MALVILCTGCNAGRQQEALAEPDTYAYSIRTKEELRSFFSLDKADIIVSGHRGGSFADYPENCLETMKRIIQNMTTFYEIDPRLTSDSVAVLLHDTTLDRTTTGKGTLRETSYAEVSKLFLKNAKGVTTPYRVPTLNEVLEWSRDKVILHIDQKEIPFTAMSELVHRMDLHNIVFSSQVPSNARYMVSVDPDVMIIAWMHSMEEFRKFEEAGVLGNIVAVWVCTDSIGKDQQELAAVSKRIIPWILSVGKTYADKDYRWWMTFLRAADRISIPLSPNDFRFRNHQDRGWDASQDRKYRRCRR